MSHRVRISCRPGTDSEPQRRTVAHAPRGRRRPRDAEGLVLIDDLGLRPRRTRRPVLDIRGGRQDPLTLDLAASSGVTGIASFSTVETESEAVRNLFLATRHPAAGLDEQGPDEKTRLRARCGHEFTP
jgi:hypothetical protein